MKDSTRLKIARFFESAKVKLFLGILLFVSAALEATEVVLADVIGFEVGVHHGMLLFSFAKIGEAVSKIGIELVEIDVGAHEIESSINKSKKDE